MRAIVTIALAALCLAACSPSPPRASAETFTATFQIQPRGTVDVREDIAVRLPPGATAFERRVVPLRADGVEFVSAALDGRDIPRTDPSLQVEDGPALHVRWRLPAAADGIHALTLQYRALNAVEIHGHRGHVRLTILDTSRGFDVRRARLSLMPPAGVALEEPSGVSEAGWTVVRESGAVVAEREDIGASETATIAGELPIDPAGMTDPVWQMNEARARQFAPAFISGGLFILVVGVGILWIVRFEHPRRRTDDEAERRVVRRGLRLGGLACLALSGVALIVTWAVLTQFGISTIAIPASIFIVGLLFVVLAGVVV